MTDEPEVVTVEIGYRIEVRTNGDETDDEIIDRAVEQARSTSTYPHDHQITDRREV